MEVSVKGCIVLVLLLITINAFPQTTYTVEDYIILGGLGLSDEEKTDILSTNYTVSGWTDIDFSDIDFRKRIGIDYGNKGVVKEYQPQVGGGIYFVLFYGILEMEAAYFEKWGFGHFFREEETKEYIKKYYKEKVCIGCSDKLIAIYAAEGSAYDHQTGEKLDLTESYAVICILGAEGKR